MHRRVLLFAVVAALLCSLVIVADGEGGGQADATADPSFVASYADGYVTIEGTSTGIFAGGYVSFEIVSPDGHTVSNAYSPISSDRSFKSQVLTNNLPDGRYAVIASFNAIGIHAERSTSYFIVGASSDFDVNVNYSDGIVHIAGKAPQGYGLGYLTCSIASSESIVSHGYAKISSDGNVSLNIQTGLLQLGDYIASLSFNAVGKGVFSAAFPFSVEYSVSTFGEYSLVIKSYTESNGITFVSCNAKCNDGSVYEYVLECEIEGGGLKIVGIDCNRDVILLVPSSIQTDVDHKVLSISESAFNNNRLIKGVVFSSDFSLDIPNNAFSGDSDLSFVKFSDNIHKIGSNAFSRTALKEVILPKYLQEIESRAFSCDSLENVFSECDASGLKYLRSWVFVSDVLKSIQIPFGDIEEISNSWVKSDADVNIQSTNKFGKFEVSSEDYKNWIFELDSTGQRVSVAYVPAHLPKEVIIPDGVKDIAAKFSTSVDSFTIRFPSTLETISGNGFQLSKVTEVKFADESKIVKLGQVFSRCDSLTEITIPSSVKVLENTFRGCTNLKTVIFKGSEIQLNGTFYNCPEITSESLRFEDGSTVKFGPEAFSSCAFAEFIIPEGVAVVGDKAFGGCRNLTSVGIPSTLQQMGSDAFNSCPSLKEFNTSQSTAFVFDGGVLLNEGALCIVPVKSDQVVVPATVETIPSGLFQNHSSLMSVRFENGHQDLAIPDNCFSGCYNLREVQLSTNVVSIGKGAFDKCAALSIFTINEESTLQSIGDQAFRGTGLLEFELPDTVRTIGDEAFSGCTVLALFRISESSQLESLGDFALSTTSIREISIPRNVESIGKFCFNGCNLLSTMTVSEDNGCYKMKNGALCRDSKLLFVPSSVSTLVIPADVESFEFAYTLMNPVVYSAFGTASSLETISVESGNNVYSSCNGMLMDKTGTTIIYVPSAIGNIIIPDGVTVLDNVDGINPFRDVVSLRSFIWDSEHSISFKKPLDSLKDAERIILRAPSIEIEMMVVTNAKAHVGILAIVASDSIKIFVNAAMGVMADRVVLESDDIHLELRALRANVLCTNNTGVKLENAVLSGASIYTPTVDQQFEPTVGEWAGTYVLDQESWTVKVSSEEVGGIPIYLENALDVDASVIGFENNVFTVRIDTSGYASTSWDVDVFVNGMLADNAGDGTYTFAVEAAPSAFDVEIKAHESEIVNTVNFETFEGSEIKTLNVYHGGTIENAMPSDPRLSGYTFGGWYVDAECTTVFDPKTRITSDITIYAKWNSNGNDVRLEFVSSAGRVSATIHGSDTTISSGQLVPKGSVIDLKCTLAKGWEFQYWTINGIELSDSEGSFTITEDSIVTPVLRYTSQSNLLSNTIDVKTPEYGEDVMLLWSKHYIVDTTMGVWSGFPSVPAIMDDAVYIRASDVLYKYDASTGELLATASSQTIVAYYLYLGIGGGVVVDYATNKVYDADLKYLYDTPVSFVSVFYNEDDGLFYGLNNGKIYRFDPATGKLNTDDEWRNGISVNWFGLYGTTSAPVFVGDHMYIVSARTSEDYRGLTEIDLKTGKTSTIELKGEAGRLLDDGWLTHYSCYGKDYLFLTTYSKGLMDTEDAKRPASIIGIEVKSDGTLSDDCKVLRLDTSSQALSAFVVFNGRGYASGHVMDADKICQAISSGKTFISSGEAVSGGYQIYEEDAVSSHGSIVLTTAYATEENDYTVYIYMLAYNPSEQAVYIFEDNQKKTEAGKYYKTSPAGSSYGSQAVRATKDGNLVWYTDSGTVFCYGTPANNPYNFQLEYNGTSYDLSGIGFTALDALKSALKSNGFEHSITRAGTIMSIGGLGGIWNVEYREGNEWYDAGLLSADTINVRHTFRIFHESGSPGEDYDLNVVINESSRQLYSSGGSNRTATISATIESDGPISIEWYSIPSSIVRIVGSNDGKSVTVESLSSGEADIVIRVRSGSTVKEATCHITVVDPPAQVKEYKFFIQMKYDADKVRHSKYTQEMLEAGIEISAEGINALDALTKACAANNILLKTYSEGDLIGWIDHLFGLGDVKLDNGLWKYWVQYHDGVYNNWTLGHYTDGGNFSLIYDITEESGVPGEGDKDSKDTTTTDDGGVKTTETETKKNDDGSTTRTTNETVSHPDGSKQETETTVDISADGSKTTTTVVVKDTDSQGNESTSTTTTTTEKLKDENGKEYDSITTVKKDSDGNVSESVSEVKKSSDGSVTEITKEKSTSSDGSRTESSSTIVTDRNGNVKETTSSESKDSKGNVTGTTESESTTTKTSGGTKTATTETSKDKDGNVTGIKETEERKEGSKTTITETSKDKDGNVTGSTEKVENTVTKGNGSTTTVSETSKDKDGNVLETKETRTEKTSKTLAGGKTQTGTTTETTVKGADGQEIEKTTTTSTTIVDSKGGRTTKVDSKTILDGGKTVTDRTSTAITTGDSTTMEFSQTTTTPEGSTTEKSSSTTTKLENGTQSESSKTTKVTDKDGKVIGSTETKESFKDTDKEKSSSSNVETVRDGVTETKESSSIESKETPGLVSTVDVEKKNGNVTRAESTTVVPADDGKLDSDAVRKAIDQSKTAMDGVSVDSKDIAKTIEVRSDSGTKVSISSDAIGMISDHGAGLVIGSDDGSIRMDDGVVGNLGRGSDDDLTIGMSHGSEKDLSDAQKRIVGDRGFIVINASIGQKDIHDLGGIATVVFGYSPIAGEDLSRLCVYYIDDEGNRTMMKAAFDPAAGMFTMETTHFSVFMVGLMEDEPAPVEDGEQEEGSDTLLYGAVAVVILAIVAAVAIMYRRKA